MIAFVILHYQTIQHTIECVTSIKEKIDTDDYHIVIVDNASPNETGKELIFLYAQDLKVTILMSNHNVGFARGNNLGFCYAKKEWKAKYIILLNGDTRILNANIFSVIEEVYNRTKAGVIGPLILSGDGKFLSNPLRDTLLTIDKIDIFLKEYQTRLWGLTNGILGGIYGWFYDIGFRIKRKFYKKKKRLEPTNYLNEMSDITLHGSFLIFTPNYIKEFDGLDERTFMYVEEDILAYRCKMKNIKMLYCPKIIIYHYEGASTELNSSIKSKQIFFYKNSIDSLLILKSILIEKEKNEQERRNA